ncbi:MAG: glycosyltransferase family 2 protein [Prevotella sp.]|nr:glycosyltransferase family 2 protein [Prevotella sp.]
MVSVCMATYNGEKFIQEQIDSILPQLDDSDELIVSDDGSSDSTLDIIASYHDDRIIVLHNQDRHGFTWNFENALRAAKGDSIFLSDQDDIWESNKVACVLQVLKTYSLVVHDAKLIDGDGKSFGGTYYSTNHRKTGFLANMWKTRWLGCCMAFRKEVLDYCLPLPSHIVAHDYWIGMSGMLKFSYCFMQDVLISYRRHGNNTSPSGGKSNNTLFYKLFTKRMNLIIALLYRRLFKS